MMFYDERIHAECGRLYKRGILYATLITVLYALSRVCFLVMSDRLPKAVFIQEGMIVLCGTVLLLIGCIRFARRHKDERMLAAEHAYYHRAAKGFLVAILAGYAWSMPLTAGQTEPDVAANELIILLEILGCCYFFYHFKNREISFNYSFIENQDGYYRCVLWNILKLAGVLLPVFLISACIVIIKEPPRLSVWSVLSVYLASVIGLGLEYLFLSWVERVSFRDVGKRPMDLAVIITASVLAGLSVLSGFWQMIAAFATVAVTDGGMVWLFGADGVQAVGPILARIAQIRAVLGNFNLVLSVLYLGYLLPHIKRGRLSRFALRATVLCSVLSYVWGQIITLTVGRIIGVSHFSALTIGWLMEFMNGATHAFGYVAVILLFLLVFGLIGEHHWSPWWIALPLLRAGALLCDYIDTLPLLRAGLNAALLIGASVLTLCLLLRVRRGSEMTANSH